MEGERFITLEDYVPIEVHLEGGPLSGQCHTEGLLEDFGDQPFLRESEYPVLREGLIASVVYGPPVFDKGSSRWVRHYREP